ncbi:MAG: hypothetical protein NC915_06605 [Candidatus Omnitrophica bacterium]|nr:hypothetical protein [Candidatus Omnitrophota bacterium]
MKIVKEKIKTKKTIMKKIESVEKEIELNNKVKARIRIEKKGPCAVYFTDKVLVKGTLFLEADEKGELRCEIRFGNRLEILGSFLRFEWGELSQAKDRYWRSKEYVLECEKYSEGFKVVEELLMKELEKLEKMIEERENKLREADDI